MPPESPNGLRTWLRNIVGTPPSAPSIEQGRVFRIPHPSKRGTTLEVQTREKGADGYTPLVDAQGKIVAAFATPESLQQYLAIAQTVNQGERAERVEFVAYTQAIGGGAKLVEPESYQGRPRITSVSSVQGGVYLPEQLHTMEAIVVDWEKDRHLRAYVEGAHRSLKALADGGKAARPLAMVRAISNSILERFQYQKKMLDQKYVVSRDWYRPNAKVALGAIMEAQDCVCRHHALIFAATMEYLKSSHAHPSVRAQMQGIETRFLAEQMNAYTKEEVSRTSGHAYCGVMLPDHVLIVDPSAGRVATLSEVALWSEVKTSYARYLYSLTRFVTDTENVNGISGELLQSIEWAKRNTRLRNVLLSACQIARRRTLANQIIKRLLGGE